MTCEASTTQTALHKEKLSVLSIPRHVKSLFSIQTHKESVAARSSTSSEFNLAEFQAISQSASTQSELMTDLILKCNAKLHSNGSSDSPTPDGVEEEPSPSNDDDDVVLIGGKPMDRHFLLQCLRVRKFVLEEAVNLVCAFHRFCTAQQWPLRASELACFPAFPSVLGSDMHTILPARDKKGRRLVTMNCANFSSDLGTPEEFHRMATSILHKVTEHDTVTQDCGVALVVDFTGASLRVLSNFSVADMRRGVDMWVNFPVKLKFCYLVGAKAMVKSTIKLVLRVVSQAMRSKIVFVDSKNYAELLEAVESTEGVPEAYGGQLREDYTVKWRNEMLNSCCQRSQA